MVIGKDLYTGNAIEQARVWLWNGEDPTEEMQRRVQAVCLNYDIVQEDIGDRLFFDSGRTTPINLAEEGRNGLVIATPVIDAVKATIVANRIDCMIVDPFVRCHRVSENDNGKINAVAESWAAIADETNAAINVIHHLKKIGTAEATAEDARGASSLIAAGRSTRVMRRMTGDEAKNAGIPEDERRHYFRIDAGQKSNMAPPVGKAIWRKLVSVSLGNDTPDRPADDVGVATSWKWPDAFEGVTVEHLDRFVQRLAIQTYWHSAQSRGWVGYLVADVLGVDPTAEADRAKIKTIIKAWIKSKAIKVAERYDPETRKKRPAIVPATAADADESEADDVDD